MNTPMMLGRQTFDGLGRQLTVDVGGHLTRCHYHPGQLPPSGNVLADGRKVAFTYEKNLNHQLLSVESQDETPLQVSYQAGLGQPSTITGALGVKSFAYTASGQALQDEWTVDGATHTTRWRYSLAGLLQGFEDARGVAHHREFDAFGRVQRTRVANVETLYGYDGLSRLISVDVKDAENHRLLTTSIAYDTLGREQTRTFVVTSGPDSEESPRTVIQTLTYSARDQIISRTWSDGEQHSEETFDYDVRDRLVHYTATPQAAPEDPYGNRIAEQAFTLNALNGYVTALNTFVDGSQDKVSFSYAQDDPTKVVEIGHTHASWPSKVTLTYDDCGRVIGDSLGRHMKWDTQGRLTDVYYEGLRCRYGYDPRGRLVDRILDYRLTRSFFSADQLTHDMTGDNGMQYIGDGDALFAVNRVAAGVRQTVLVGTDAQGSVRLEADDTLRPRTYTAQGASPENTGHTPFGYAGERREPLTGWYMPGGHRPYDPVLMCFLAPDSESPFGRGGINPYTYCAGDPVNRVDPDGHSWVNYALAGAGLTLAAIALIPGLQAAVPAVGALFSATSTLSSAQIACLAAATLDVVSLTTGVASLALEISGHDGAATRILGGISLATGAVGAGIGLKMHSLRNAGAKQRALDVKRGWMPPKPHRLGNSDIMHQGTSRAVDVGFIETYRGTHQAALLTHGDPVRALLMGPDGKVAWAADLARDFIAPRLQALNYPADETFVLLSCWSGRNGAARDVARELGRPVQGFTHKIYVRGFSHLQMGATAKNAPLEAIPYLERMRATGNPFKAWKTTFREARSHLYHPDGTVTAV